MTTNREWLYSLDVADLADWFDAEHVHANDVSTRKSDVRADDVCANDANVAQDSREKLEADLRKEIREYAGEFYEGEEVLFALILAMFDRQAAITERECIGDAGKASLMGVVAHERECYDKRIAELTAERDALADGLLTCNKEREEYRELFSKAITQAAEIVNLQP